jgi:hypothetical protein
VTRNHRLGYSDLVAFIDAMEVWKRELQNIISQQASETSRETQLLVIAASTSRRRASSRYGRPKQASYANQGLRRSTRRIGLGTIHSDSATLFVPENSSESESENEENHAQSGMLNPALPANCAGLASHAASEIQSGEPSGFRERYAGK